MDGCGKENGEGKQKQSQKKKKTGSRGGISETMEKGGQGQGMDKCS
jgi:hypothetical protein